MPKFTNISDGPRGIRMTSGLVMVERGATVEGDPAENETPNKDWFKSDGEDDAPAGPVSLSGKNKAELLAIAEAEKVTIEDGATNDDIKAAIELAREEAAKD